MTHIIDSHAHLTYLSDNPEKIRDIAARFPEAQHRRILDAGVKPSDIDERLTLLSGVTGVILAAGIHPHHAHEMNNGDITAFTEHIRRLNTDGRKICAIGEIGLDYYYGKDTVSAQRNVFAEALDAASSLGLPALVHARDAFDDIFKLITASKVRNGMLHCFTGGVAEAKRALDLGFILSFAGNVTYKKSPQIREAAAYVPADRYTVETDCPYLAPMPLRGKDNEPAFVVHTAACIAQLRGTDTDTVFREAYENAARVIGY
ncbi:MAG: TatD family hydrolase [Spirochaetes bacterium]|nr:TatD family hydrolase [Spirochaetota bacterium]